MPGPRHPMGGRHLVSPSEYFAKEFKAFYRFSPAWTGLRYFQSVFLDKSKYLHLGSSRNNSKHSMGLCHLTRVSGNCTGFFFCPHAAVLKPHAAAHNPATFACIRILFFYWGFPGGGGWTEIWTFDLILSETYIYIYMYICTYINIERSDLRSSCVVLCVNVWFVNKKLCCLCSVMNRDSCVDFLIQFDIRNL